MFQNIYGGDGPASKWNLVILENGAYKNTCVEATTSSKLQKQLIQANALRQDCVSSLNTGDA